MREYHFLRTSLTCLLLAGMVTSAAAQEPELLVEIEKQEIYAGESVLYRVTLNHVENPVAPELVGFDAFQVTPAGERSLDSRQITIINGRRSEVVRRGRQYNYQLTPRRSGQLTIPAPTASLDGQVLTGREIKLKVVPPDDQEGVILEFTTDHESVYPMQPFELKLTIAVKDLPGELKDRDPLSVQPKPPALEVAWLSDERLPKGIQPKQSWRQLLEPLVSRRGHGFQMNNIGSSSVFSLFGNEATRFHPPPQRTSRKAADGEELGYWEYQFKRTLLPRQQGKYTFSPATIKGTFADRIEQGQLAGKRIYALSRGVDVEVKDVPREGRPDSYIHAIGQFKVQTTLTPTSVRVGDPMTLTLTLTGEGTLADARPPTIAALPGIENVFRTYEATEESSGGKRRFTYSLRPLSTDVAELPSIPVSYFDVEAEAYVTIATDPIAVTVQAAETLSSSDIVAAPSQSAEPGSDLEVSAAGIFANDSNLSGLRNQRIRPERWLALWTAMFGCWIGTTLVMRYVQQVREDPALLRRRSAPARARVNLETAATLLSSGSAAEVCESLRRTITSLVADYANVSAAGLTPRETKQQLQALGVESAVGIQAQELLNACEGARYGAAAAEDVAQLHAGAARLVEQILSELGKSSRKWKPARHSAMLLLLGSLLTGCGSAPDLELSRKFQAAQQAFQQAASVEDFARVAQQYEQISGATFASGAVLYNQGNAWMRADETGRAIAAYRQALRYRPRDPYLTANLHSALTSAGGQSIALSAGSPIAGYVFFWQHWLSYPEKFLLTTCLLAATLMTLLLSQVAGGWKRVQRQILWRRLSFALAAACLLAAASTCWDWYRFDQTTYGVVVADQAVARKGNSETYEAAFNHPLSVGTEFVVLEQRKDWLHIAVGDSATGWLRRRDVQTY